LLNWPRSPTMTWQQCIPADYGVGSAEPEPPPYWNSVFQRAKSMWYIAYSYYYQIVWILFGINELALILYQRKYFFLICFSLILWFDCEREFFSFDDSDIEKLCRSIMNSLCQVAGCKISTFRATKKRILRHLGNFYHFLMNILYTVSY
jgi:hypothetical protein